LHVFAALSWMDFDAEAALLRQLVRRLTDKLAATKSNCTTTVKILLLKVYLVVAFEGASSYTYRRNRGWIALRTMRKKAAFASGSSRAPGFIPL